MMPLLIMGLPDDLIITLMIMMVIMMLATFFFFVRGVPVKALYIRENGTGRLYDAKEQIGGVFMEIIRRRKVVLTVTKEGQAVEVNLGGLRRQRWHLVNEGNMKTLSFLDKERKQDREDAHTTVLHDEKAAAGEYLNMMYQAAQSKFKTLILPLLSGISIGACCVLVITIVLGRLK